MKVSDRILGGQGHPWCHGWPCLTQRKIPWKFCVDIFIRSVSRMGVLVGRWEFLTGDLEDMDDLFWPQRRYPESFVLISLIEVCQEWGVLRGGTWRTLRVPDRRLWEQGHSWCHQRPCFTQRKIPWKFCVDILIRSVLRMGGPSWGYLGDVKGSWQRTWMTGSSLMSWMILFYPKEDTMKVSCWYLY